MARTEDGEFELILGNKQLLSVFFIVVVLLGVFFSMGYIVGKNSVAPSDYAKQREPIVVDPSSPVIQKPSALDPKPGVTEPKPVPTETVVPPKEDPEAARKEARRKEEERKAEDARKEAARKEEARLEELARKEREARTLESKSKKKEDPPRKTEDPSPLLAGKPPVLLADGTPGPGQTFLQVVGSTRPDCELVASVLKRKGFMATVVPGPDSKLFRVVVGPLPDAAAISRTRSEIEKAGFSGAFIKKY
ncbi:MAG: hypothetical protein HY820_25260 [Acidobacteria bacterium]|nr:hypothetical protein [Acidobacteriota bacterium]